MSNTSHSKRYLMLLPLFALSLTQACKTQEDIRRERSIENMNEKIKEAQVSTASTSSRFQVLEEQVSKLTGNLEENNFKNQENEKMQALLREKMAILEDQSKKQSEAIKLLSVKVDEQSKYIEQVVKTLTDLSSKESLHKEEEKKKAEKNKEAVSEGPSLKKAMQKFKSNELKEAKLEYLELLENKKLSKKDKAQIIYYLGLVEFKQKSYEDAKIYFSRLFTEYPDSQYNPSALLNLAKSFSLLKAHTEAKEAIDELVDRYPKSKEAQEGLKIKAKL